MPEPDRHPVSVLVVDDDPLAAQRLAEYVRAAGHEVLTATNSADALRILAADAPPMVITDWVMPGIDGLELCRAIRDHEGIPFTYVIVLTVRSSEEDLTKAFDAGANDYLVKPVKQRELLVRIRAGESVIQIHRDLERRNREVHVTNAKLEIAHRRLTRANERLIRMATTDALTGLINRREALTRLADYWASAQRHGRPLACIAIDLDHFKSINDAHGHALGDLVLQEVARILQETARREEKVCRIGGEEFLVICPHSTDVMAAVGAERIRHAVETHVIKPGDLELGITMSLGVAQRTLDMTSPDHLLRAADDALYVAKAAGRNRVCLASEQPACLPTSRS